MSVVLSCRGTQDHKRREAFGLNARVTALWALFSACAMLRLNAAFQLQVHDQLPLVRQRGVQVERSTRQRRHLWTFALPHQGSLDHDIQSLPQVRAANQRFLRARVLVIYSFL